MSDAPDKTKDAVKRGILRAYLVSTLTLIVFFAVIYVSLRRAHCPGGNCDDVFPVIRHVLVRMAGMGSLIIALCGLTLQRVFKRVN